MSLVNNSYFFKCSSGDCYFVPGFISTDEKLAKCQFTIDLVTKVFIIDIADIFTKNRNKANFAFIRQIAMYLSHVVCGLRFTEIAILFNRDRTTASHACHVIEGKRDDPEFDRSLNYLESAINLWQGDYYPNIFY